MGKKVLAVRKECPDGKDRLLQKWKSKFGRAIHRGVQRD